MMPGRRLAYREGDVVAVPLRDGGHGLGVVARMNGRGAVLGYFFGQRHDELPGSADLGELTAADNVLVQRFGDLGLIRGRWPVIGQLPGWRRDEWPMPAFGRREELTGRCWQVEYDDDDPNSQPCEVLVSHEECERLPADGAAGHGFVEARLTTLLATPTS